MVGLRRFWTAFKNVAILFSFIMNFVLIIVLLIVGMFLFDIKTGLAEPILGGLYSSFVGLNEARIITTIQVQDTINVKDQIQVVDKINVKDVIPVVLDIPLQQNTVVVLTEPVPLRVGATLTGQGINVTGTVAITLPQGLRLPVALDLRVPVDSQLPIDLQVPVNLNVPVDLKVPVNLNVPVDIPLDKTQLNDVAQSLRLVIEPLTRLITNLPDNWPDMWRYLGNVLAGRGGDLLAPNKFTSDPWPGFRTGPGATLPTFTPSPTPSPDGTLIIVPYTPPTVDPAIPTATATPPIPPTATIVVPTPTPTLTFIDPNAPPTPTPVN
jgi:hypothetical protein